MSVNIKTEGLTGDVYLIPYKSYVALLTQSGTGSPVATVINNNDNNYLGNIVWTRELSGYYLGTLLGAFTNSKTVMFITPSATNSYIIVSSDVNANFIELITFDFNTATEGDSNLVDTPIEIKVYQ